VIKEAFQDLNRLRQIAVIATKHGFADLLERSGLWRTLGRKEKVEVTPEERRESAARRFRLLLSDLGPTYIKLGQVLSTRGDLLPAEFIEELASLQDHAPPIPFEQVTAQLQTAFGRPHTELFRSIEPEPLASASIAQVHSAITLEGDEVVVKIQRPMITDQLRADLSVLRYLASALEAVIEEVGLYSPTGIIEEFDRAIHEELDFVHEAANVRAFFHNHQGRPGVKIPKVYDDLSTRTVLTLERIKGTKISQVDLEKHDRHKLARAIIDLSFRQLFEDGLFHGDPHPGNIFVLEDDTLALIDFGIVGRISPQMQDTLVQLVLSIALRDADSVARILYRVGTPDTRTNLAGFRGDIEGILSQYKSGTTLGSINAENMLRDLLDLAVKYRIRVPKEYALLSRASISTEGILRTLDPDLNVGEVALPYAKKLLTDRYDPSQLQGGIMRTLLRMQGLATELPMQLSQILMDLETGKFSVTVKADQLDRLNNSLRMIAAIGFLGLTACAFIIGAFISFAHQPWRVWGMPALGLFGAVAAGSTFGAAFTWYLAAGRLRKLSLRRFLKR
jgi:ubiquinone biosynthesis protein